LENEEVEPLKVHLQVKAMEDIINSLTCTDEKKNKTFQPMPSTKRSLIAVLNGRVPRHGINPLVVMDYPSFCVMSW
jgi:hypothetical protein